MSQLSDVQTAQKSLEEMFSRRMGELEAQIQTAGPAKDTVAKVAEEFRHFRELMFSMLGILRKQIDDCCKVVDGLETRQRRKVLVFSGIQEEDKEDCTATTLSILHSKLSLRDVSASHIKVCHRLGSGGKEQPRPILVRFTNVETKAAVWKAKSRLKGSSVSVKEFLTRSRQVVFGKSRQHFGMRSCWSQDGIINIKCPDGTRHKITSMEDLTPLISKYPKVSSEISTTGRGGGGGNLKARK